MLRHVMLARNAPPNGGAAPETRRLGRTGATITAVIAAGVLALGLFAAFVVAWDRPRSPIREALDDTLLVREVLRNPTLYLGRTVAVRAEAELSLGARALLITERGLPAGLGAPGGAEMLVVTRATEGPEVIPSGLSEGEWIVARGVLRRLDEALAEVSLAAPLPARLLEAPQRPAIVATWVARVAA